MHIGIIGAGGWGTALSKTFCDSGHLVTLWCRENDVLNDIQVRHINRHFLPGIELPSALKVTSNLSEVAAGAEMIVLAVPSQYMRGVLSMLAPFLGTSVLLVSATKGIEEGTLFRMSQVIDEVLSFDTDIVAISGPTFAQEVGFGKPTALVAASRDPVTALSVQAELSTPSFRIYTNDDVVGVELGGALKNVVAIAAGVASGLGLGHNTLAALMTRGLAEVSRLSEALGGKRETLAGLSGMGDLVLTCTGGLSRNRRVGIQLGEGKTLAEILDSMEMVAEGVRTTHAAVALARKYDVEMAIVFQMERLLRGETTPPAAIRALMSRPLKAE